METQPILSTSQPIPPSIPVVPITPPPTKPNFFSKLWKFFFRLTIFLGFLVFVYFFLARPYSIGGDPLPELASGRFALAEKVSYLYKNPQVGDTIIFANNSLNLPFIGIITKIENVENLTQYTVRSSGKPINPWVISRDKILAHVYYPKVSIPKDEASVSPSPSPTLDPTTGWQTFIDTQTQISFQYPSKYTIETQARDAGDGFNYLFAPEYKFKLTVLTKFLQTQVLSPQDNGTNQLGEYLWTFAHQNNGYSLQLHSQGKLVSFIQNDEKMLMDDPYQILSTFTFIASPAPTPNITIPMPDKY